MATVRVAFSMTASVSKVWMDGVRLTFGGDGTAEKNLANGRKHVLQWIVRGAPAATYSIAVTAPNTVAKRLASNHPLDDDRIGFGQYEFQL